VLPDVGVAVLSKAFVVEAVYLGNLAGLMVASKDGDALRIADFEGDKKSDSLDRVISTIHIVSCERLLAKRVTGCGAGSRTHEEVVCVWVWTSDPKQLHQVMELTMDIPTDSHRAFLDGRVLELLSAISAAGTYDRLDIRFLL
jgi:hypothetical protein